jgi:hypothetical protein
MLEKRGLRLAGAAAAGVLGAQVTSLVMFTSPVAAFQTVTYHYTGAEQFLTVPAGVTTLQVTLIGAPGAAGSTVSGAAGQGGRGARQAWLGDRDGRSTSRSAAPPLALSEVSTRAAPVGVETPRAGVGEGPAI